MALLLRDLRDGRAPFVPRAQVRAERDLEATAQADAVRGRDDGRGYPSPEVANVLRKAATQSVVAGRVSVVSYPLVGRQWSSARPRFEPHALTWRSHPRVGPRAPSDWPGPGGYLLHCSRRGRRRRHGPRRAGRRRAPRGRRSASSPPPR